MSYLYLRVVDWMTYEPAVGLMMIVAAVALFIGAWRARPGGDAAWSWARRLIEAGAVAVLFLGLLWGFRAVLNDNASTFDHSHGRVSEANYRSLQTIWGAPHVQQELEVTHRRTVTVREETWREDPTLPPLYRDTERVVMVPQNSITSSHGTADLTLNQRRKGSALYNGFEAAFAVAYEVVNHSEHATRAELTFPLSGQVLYDDLRVNQDDVDISRDVQVQYDGLVWTRAMEPGETVRVSVSYRTRGVEHFYYQVPTPRELRDFSFVMRVDGMSPSQVNYPEGCLTPHRLDGTSDGVVLEWALDRAVTTAGLGIALPKPAQPGVRVSRVLSRSPYALMLMVVAVCLTLLVRGDTVSLLDLSLLSALYCALFLIMAAASDYLFGFWGSLGLGAALSMALTAALYWRHPARGMLLALVGFFTAVYPLSGLFGDHADNFDSAVVVALVVYLFAIALLQRLGQQGSRAPSAT